MRFHVIDVVDVLKTHSYFCLSWTSGDFGYKACLKEPKVLLSTPIALARDEDKVNKSVCIIHANDDLAEVAES